MLNEKELEKLVAKYRAFFQNTIKIYVADKPNIKAPCLIFNKGEDVYTNSKEIVIGIKALEVEDEDEFLLQVLYFLGHEIQHVRSTPTKDWLWGQKTALSKLCIKLSDKIKLSKTYNFKNEKHIEEFLEEAKSQGYNMSLRALKEIIHFVMNSLEDGRIERIRSKVRNGFKRQVVYFRGRDWDKNPIEKEANELTIIVNQILSLSTTSLYQKGFLDEFADTQLEDKIRNLHTNIGKGVLSGNCRNCMKQGIEICEKLADDIIEYCKKSPLEELLEQIMKQINSWDYYSSGSNEEETDNGEGDSVFGDSDIEIEMTEDEYKKLKDSSDEDPSGDGKVVKIKVIKDDENNTEENTENDTKTSNENGEEQTDDSRNENADIKPNNFHRRGERDSLDSHVGNANTEGVSEKIKEAMEMAALEAKGEIQNAKNTAKTIEKKHDSLEKDETPIPSTDEVNESYKYHVKFEEFKRRYHVSEPLPNDIAAQANVFKRKIDDFFRNKEVLAMRGRRSGKIDVGNLYKVAMKQINCFEKKGMKYKFDGCCYILTDNSGSMGYGFESKRYEACRAMAMIETAFVDKMPLKLTAFDAHGNNHVTHEVIKNWNEHFKFSTAYNFLVKGRGGCGNKDGYSIRVATQELLKRPEKQKLLIVLSDGAPTDYIGSGVVDTSNAVDEARKAGITVVSIFFPDNYCSEREKREFLSMYKFNAIATEPANVTKELVRILKAFISK